MVKAQQRYNGHDVIDCSFTADNGFRLIGKTVVNAGINNIDDFITFAYNAEGIIQNHSMFQTLGYLRVEDSFYND